MEKLHVQPSELDMLPYYEYEYIVEIYNDIVKERNDEEKKQNQSAEDKYNVGGMQRNMNKKVQSYKTPAVPKFNVPRF
jgi:hypothetical protein